MRQVRYNLCIFLMGLDVYVILVYLTKRCNIKTRYQQKNMQIFITKCVAELQNRIPKNLRYLYSIDIKISNAPLHTHIENITKMSFNNFVLWCVCHMHISYMTLTIDCTRAVQQLTQESRRSLYAENIVSYEHFI